MIDTDFQASLHALQLRNQAVLTHWLDNLDPADIKLADAIKYAALLGGKRIRPFLTYATGNMFGTALQDLDTPAAAIELIHAYSLVHDDLPAMDDDALRRGKPTCHIAFDEATAILAGDSLHSLAFEVLASGALSPNAEPYRIKMIQALANAAGAQGMCLGQALDLDAEGKTISLTALETIHNNKTGALIRCAVRLGALASGEIAQPHLNALDAYANAIGLAFQVQDDILDITGDTATLGKQQGSDLALHKSTYPALLGLAGAKQKASELYTQAQQALSSIPYNTQQLEFFARYIIERTN